MEGNLCTREEDSNFKYDFRNESGKWNYPQRQWYMRTAKTYVGVVDNLEDQNGVFFPRKAMMQCDLPKNIDETGRMIHSSNNLQEIVTCFSENLNNDYLVHLKRIMKVFQ